ncbi:stage II sporulation protein M [Sphingomonas sp. RHCKR7]|uniref:stage II sporulation protein M n=1 Tax=Sphingomonas folli TaxID=2862497 RepID=UPI001C662E37|nr:stage II sporulation protein M [Sphingomonas folli]MBW6526449.1 stage II sporulation protein M [Sphingomonas folli]
MSAPTTSSTVAGSRFRAAHEADWTRLDALLARAERRSVRALDDDDLLALPLLYRTALSSLASARATSLDRSLIIYLEQLCARAYFQLYGPAEPAAAQVIRFFRHDWPAAVRGLWRETLAALVLTLAGVIAGYLLVRGEASWFYGLVPDGLAGGRAPGASAATLRATLHPKDEQGMLAVFAAFLFTHNAQIAIFSFALGIAFGVPTALLIAYNGLSLGAMMAVFAGRGVGVEFAQWLAIHGTTELFAVILAGAAGFRIGAALAFPGRQARLDAALDAGRAGATVMLGTVLMLAVAGLLEGIGRQTIDGGNARALIGVVMLGAWLLYFYLPRSRDDAR